MVEADSGVRFLAGSQQNEILIKNHNADRTTPLAMANFPQGVFVNVTDDGKGTELELQ
jgi:hypothetical protein